MTVRAAAKINLHLGVGRVRDDGFHPLDTVYQAIWIYDDVTLSVADEDSPGRRASPTTSTSTTSPPTPTTSCCAPPGCSPSAPCGGPHGAFEVAQGHPGRGRHGRRVGRRRRGPGRARPAARARTSPTTCCWRWRPELGSDIPFSLVGGTARGVGRGELVTPVDDRGSWWWVAVPSAVGLSTPAVYRHFDALRPDAPEAPASGRAAARGAGDRRARCGWRGRCTTTCRSRRSTCAPSSAT